MITTPTISKKSIEKSKTDEKIKQLRTNFKTESDPETVLKDLSTMYGSYDRNDSESLDKVTDLLFDTFTLSEFDNGLLMSIIISKHYRTFAIEMLRQLQKEYNCVTFSEKATAELATINYVRTLELQAGISSSLNKGITTELGTKFLTVIGKELDRASRHYLTAIQILRLMKQPPMQVKITTDTAIVGQNQVIQSNHND